MTESYLRFFQLTEAVFSKEVIDKDLWLPPSKPAVCTAAPESVIRSVTVRPLSGSSRIRSFSITCPTPAFRVSTSAAFACTSICSLI